MSKKTQRKASRTREEKGKEEKGKEEKGTEEKGKKEKKAKATGPRSWSFYLKGGWHTYAPEVVRELEAKRDTLRVEDHDGPVEKKKKSDRRIRCHLDDADEVTTSNTVFYLVKANQFPSICGCCKK